MIIRVPVVLAPFPDISEHVVKAPPVGGIRTDQLRSAKRRPTGVRRAIRASSAVVACFAAVDLIAPGIGCRRTRSRGVFPFRLGEQPVSLSGLARKPRYVIFRVIPGNVDDGSPTSTPPLVRRSAIVNAAATPYAGIPLVEGRFESANCNGGVESHGMQRLFAVVQFRSHQETTRGDHDHLRAAIAAILKYTAGSLGLGRGTGVRGLPQTHSCIISFARKRLKKTACRDQRSRRKCDAQSRSISDGRYFGQRFSVWSERSQGRELRRGRNGVVEIDLVEPPTRQMQFDLLASFSSERRRSERIAAVSVLAVRYRLDS